MKHKHSKRLARRMSRYEIEALEMDKKRKQASAEAGRALEGLSAACRRQIAMDGGRLIVHPYPMVAWVRGR